MTQESFVFEDMKELFTGVFGNHKDLWKFSFNAIDDIFTVHGRTVHYTEYLQIKVTKQKPASYVKDVIEYEEYETQDGPNYFVPQYPVLNGMSLTFVFSRKGCVVNLKDMDNKILMCVLTVNISDEWYPQHMEMIKLHLEKIIHHDLFSPALPL
jgi:hypothetical protein